MAAVSSGYMYAVPKLLLCHGRDAVELFLPNPLPHSIQNMTDENDIAYYSSGKVAEPLSSISDEEYEPPIFVPSRLIERISNVPRFSHSPSIAYAASGDDQARQDYLEGAVFTSSVILLTFVVWLVILLVLKVMGSKRVGCASGKAPTYPSLESIQAANHTLERQYEMDAAREQAEGRINGEHSITGGQDDGVVGEDMDQWLHEVKVIERRVRRIRIVFLICGAIILPTSLALIAAGFRVLDRAFNETQKNVVKTQEVINNNLQRVDALISSGKQAIEVRDVAMEQLSAWCPNALASENNTLLLSAQDIPSTLDAIDNGDGTISVNLYNQTNELIQTLEDLEEFLVSGSERVEETLMVARQNAIKVNDAFDETSWWFYFAVVFVVLVDILTLLFMAGACFAWTYRLPVFLERVQTYVIFPIFSGLLALLWLCVSGFVFTLVLNADLCSGSPEENVVAILHQKEKEMEPLLFDMASYYVEGCTLEEKPEKPTILFDNFLPYLNTGIVLSQKLTTKIGAIGISNLSRACRANVKGTANTMTYLLQTLSDVQEKTKYMIEGLYCSNFNPIYSKNMYDAICYDGVRGLTAIFVCLFIITVMGMTMVSLRVAAHEVKNESNWIEELGLNVEYADEMNMEGKELYCRTNSDEVDVVEEAVSEIADDGALHVA